MLIGGLQKCSLIDYPEKVSAIVFTQGCPWQCPFCHNGPLQSIRANKNALIEVETVFQFLESRRGKLDGVVVSGGEPTIHTDLIPFLVRIKSLGFSIKLDTNGLYPDRIEAILHTGVVDFWAMDVKGPLPRYSEFIGCPVDADRIQHSINLIRDSNAQHEFRTTAIRTLHTLEDLKEIAPLVRGAKRYTLQQFLPKNAASPALRNEHAYTPAELWTLKPHFEVGTFLVR